MHAPSPEFALHLPLAAEAVLADARPGEGHDCEASRRVSAQILWPHGGPGAWSVLLAATCVFVVVEAVAQRFA